MGSGVVRVEAREIVAQPCAFGFEELVDSRLPPNGSGSLLPNPLLQQVSWTVSARNRVVPISPRDVNYRDIASDDLSHAEQLVL